MARVNRCSIIGLKVILDDRRAMKVWLFAQVDQGRPQADIVWLYNDMMTE
jgi:hypothetical protein